MTILRFGAGLSEAGASDSDMLGGKGANLCEMAAMGLPVPSGFVISLDAFHAWRDGKGLPVEDIGKAVEWLESVTGLHFGGAEKPLLVAVRSGAPVSMPGMLDTILNVGLTEDAREALGVEASPRFVEDCRRRLIPALAASAMDVEAEEMEDAIDDWLVEHGRDSLADMDAGELKALNTSLMTLAEEEGDGPFPETAFQQLHAAIEGVFESWSGQRARAYRAMHGLGDELGTAVVVQAMVFGNRREGSATGVVFTRDPSTGEKSIYGEYLENAQGEDVVAGIRTPAPLTKTEAVKRQAVLRSMEERMPDAFASLVAVCEQLEKRFADAQDIEFTVDQGTLWVLQTRSAKCSAKAAMRIAVEMADDGAISSDDALLRFAPTDIDRMLHPMIDPKVPRESVARGLPASPGAVTGEVCFTAAEAETLSGKGRSAILVRIETSPEDIHGMYAAAGVLTVRGGMTSHAAVVARGLGTPCVCGAGDARVDLEAGILLGSNGKEIRRGDILTIDGAAGQALLGAVEMVEPEPEPAFTALMAWADARRRMRVRANADTAMEATVARRLGAEGIGLARTEHAFFQPGRLPALQEMILAESPDDRRAALSHLIADQRADFLSLFEAMEDLPVCIRLLDPPLHEFLPSKDEDVARVAEAMGVSFNAVNERVDALREFNPMLGRRGCRIGIVAPEIYDMQIRAILQAATDYEERHLRAIDLEIMVPFVSSDHEMRLMSERVETMAAALTHSSGLQPSYRIGAMLETPRSCLRANIVCKHAEFISFGTNDLTQMVYGLSRDDTGRFIRAYIAKGALSADPFHRLDQDGVGELMAIAVERGRATRKGLTISICGEHGGDPTTIRFCERLGVDYISCSPYRTPAARLAAAQATILQERENV